MKCCSGGRRLRARSPGWSACRSAFESVRFSPGRHAARGHRRSARPHGRGPGLGRRQEEAHALRADDLRHALRRSAGRPTARRSPSAAPITRVRAIDAKTGEQVLFLGSHTDWVLDTVFSTDGSHLISVGRDMAVKLTEVATQRFVDNITSITPGALKGGVRRCRPAPEARRVRRRRLGRHAPGLPRLPRDGAVKSATTPTSSASSPRMPGRIFSVAVSPDGKRIAAGQQPRRPRARSSSRATTTTPMCRPTSRRSWAKVSRPACRQERKTLDDYRKKGLKELSSDQDRHGGHVRRRLPPRRQDAGRRRRRRHGPPLRPGDRQDHQGVRARPAAKRSPRPPRSPRSAFPKDAKLEAEKLPAGAKVVALEVEPKSITLGNPYQYVQLLVTAQLSNGEAFDATRVAEVKRGRPSWRLSRRSGLVRPTADGEATLRSRWAGKSAEVPVSVPA